MQQALADRGLLPAEQLLDPGYLAGHTVVESAARHAMTLVGPANADHQWQARAQTGYALAQFQVDWAAQRVTCPEQQQSRGWYAHQTARGPRISVMFAASDCAACPVRSACTRATRTGRRLTLQPPSGASGAGTSTTAAAYCGLPARLRQAGGDRRHALAGCAWLRPAAGPLSRSGQDPAPARGDGSGHQT